MTDEIEPQTAWKGKGPIVYTFNIELPKRDANKPAWHSDTLGDAWKYRLSVTGAPGENENNVPEISFIAETKPGIIRDMAAYIDLGRNKKDKQFLNLPQISPDNIEIIDRTNGQFRGMDINATFANATRLSNMQPPPGEPTYIIEITKNDNEPQDKQYNVGIVYANGFIDYTGLMDSEESSREGVDKFSKIPARLVPGIIARYLITAAQRNDIRPSPTNMKIINFTDNPDFTVPQILGALRTLIPPTPKQVQTPTARIQQIPSRQMVEQQIVPARRAIGQEEPIRTSSVTEKKEMKPEKEEEEKGLEDGAKKSSDKKGKWSHFYNPKYGFDSVIGMDYAKKFFNDNVILGLKRPDLFAKYKKNIRDGFLLYGPPGIGKTYIVGALAKEAKMKMLVVSIHQLLDQYVGNTEKNIHAVFEQARENAPCIILFDEIDGLGASRNISRESGSASSALALNQLLMEMDGLESDNENVIVMGTTNSPQDIDSALLRSGRFTNMLYMRPPDKEDRTKLFKFYAEDIPAEKIDYEKLGGESGNLSPADINAVVKAAVTPLIAEAAESGEIKNLTTEDLLRTIRARRASGSTMIKWYEDVDKILRKGGFTEEDKLLYGEMLKDMKTRIKRPSGKRRGRRIKRGGRRRSEMVEPARTRLRA